MLYCDTCCKRVSREKLIHVISMRLLDDAEDHFVCVDCNGDNSLAALETFVEIRPLDWTTVLLLAQTQQQNATTEPLAKTRPLLDENASADKMKTDDEDTADLSLLADVAGGTKRERDRERWKVQNARKYKRRR
jgi:hypothetical protein